MPTNLHIDDALLNELMQLGQFKTKREAVNTAVKEHLDYLRRLKSIEAFGTFDLGPGYDRKAEARRHAEKMVRMGIWPETALHPRKRPKTASKPGPKTAGATR